MEELRQVADLITAKDFAIAELQAITDESSLSEMRAHIEEAINFIDEAEEVLNFLEEEKDDE